MRNQRVTGHFESWARAFPGITINTGQRHGVSAYGIANLASPDLLGVVQKVIAEAAAWFDDEAFFLGGDETACPYNECDYFSYPDQAERCPHESFAREGMCRPFGF